MLDALLIPEIGKKPIAELTAPDLLAALRKVESRGTLETAHRAKQLAGRVLRFAIATGRATRDVSADLRGALAPAVTHHRAAVVDPAEIAQLLRAIHS